MNNDFYKSILIIGKSIQAIHESMKPMQQVLGNSVPPGFLAQIFKFGEVIKDLPERQRAAWCAAARAGWYINGETGLSSVRIAESGITELNNYMSQHLADDWDAIVKNIYAVSPKRMAIIMSACKLHKEGNFIASIPLFLMQADGLFQEEFGEYLFARKAKFERGVKNKIETAEPFLFVLLKIISEENQFRADIKNSNIESKILAPNRHGIIHGSSDHLDYATEINSYKSFSLLAFIALLLSCCRPIAKFTD